MILMTSSAGRYRQGASAQELFRIPAVSNRPRQSVPAENTRRFYDQIQSDMGSRSLPLQPKGGDDE